VTVEDVLEAADARNQSKGARIMLMLRDFGSGGTERAET